MKSPSRPTRRASARTSRRRGSGVAPPAQTSPPDADASIEPPTSPEGSLEVTFCAVQRVAGRAFLLLCTRSHWRLYRLDGFSAARESCTPVQLLADPQKDAARLCGVRFFRLYELPASAGSAPALGALFVSERSRDATPPSDDEDEDFVAATAEEDDDDGREDISALALDQQKLLHQLPPSPSLVLDVQTNAATAAVLCETRELFLYDLATFQLLQTIVTASPAMALGARWLAYPGYAQDGPGVQTNGRQQSLSGLGDSDSDFDDLPSDVLVNGGVAVEASRSSSPAYTAIDVAQNVASGLYYLSEVGRATIAPYLSSSPGKPSNGTQNLRAQASPSGRRSSGRSRKSSLNESLDTQHHKSQSREEIAASASKKHPGWVVVLDLVTKRVVANFPCHSTALVNLSMDFSGLLLATSSTKGQNLHVYRLSPPLQSVVNKPGGVGVAGHGSLHHQLVYKLQRGITHASIQDIAFSQDGKWINVTSAHGTSHLYALHPEGVRVQASDIVRAIDEDHPEGRILQVKRKGPNPSQDLSASTMAMAPEGFANGDEQLFVMEMDSYFGIGGSPVFDGRGGGGPATPEVPPPLDLAASINMAMSSSLSETPPKPIPEVKNTICFRPIDQNSPPEINGVIDSVSNHKGKKKKGKIRRAPTPPSSSEAEVEVIEEGSTTGGLASLQFTMQDMYFAVPTDEASG
ncbi:autophagy-related protein 18h-like [Phytophthora cinnamomi]|uniref:autophagy-related protein 18h-like n=1 Tax=Phytophthora cinnamomi TaxID=4785 RepID=UPI003559A0D3|nr:autophagy-related protein 18h-like [Phytophthora cinnamomi]